MSRLSILSYLSTLTAFTALVACADDAPPSPDVQPVDESTLHGALDTWKQQLRKACSIEAAFGVSTTGELANLDLDAALVVSRLGGKLWSRDDASGELVVLQQPPHLHATGFSNATLTVRAADGSMRDATLGANLAVDGTCVVSLDGVEVFRGTVWDELPVLVHAKTATDLATRDGTIDRYANPNSVGPGYYEIDGLDAIVDALYPDLARAATRLAPSLGLAPADVAKYLTAAPTWLAHVEADDALAPFPILGTSISPDPMPVPFYFAPLVPSAQSSAVDWLPTSGSRTHVLRVALPRPTVAGSTESSDRPLQLTFHIAIDSSPMTTGGLRVRVVDVGAPVEIAGGASAATACFAQTTAASLAYAQHPQLQVGNVPRFPSPVMTGFGVPIASEWLLAPCAPLTGDLFAALRADRDSLNRVVDVLSPSRYSGPQRTKGIAVRGWDVALAQLAPDAAGMTALEAVSAESTVLAPGLRAQRTLIADGRYVAAKDDERLARRTLAWRASLFCGADLTADQQEQLLEVPADKVADTIWNMNDCPWQ